MVCFQEGCRRRRADRNVCFVGSEHLTSVAYFVGSSQPLGGGRSGARAGGRLVRSPESAPEERLIGASSARVHWFSPPNLFGRYADRNSHNGKVGARKFHRCASERG